MKIIREAVHDFIEQRILTWVERDGVENLLLPEQITPDLCAKPIKCRQLCRLQHRNHEIGFGLTGESIYCVDNKRLLLPAGRMVFIPAGTTFASDQTTVRFIANIDIDKPPTSLWLTVYPFGIRVQVSHMMIEDDAMDGTLPYMLLDMHFSRLMTWLLEEIQTRPSNYTGVGRAILIEFLERCLRAPTATGTTVDADRRIKRPSGSSKRSGHSRSRKTPRAKQTKPVLKQFTGRIRAAEEFIHANYHMPLGLDDIADAVNTSTDYFRRQFKTVTGVTPIQYLMDVRMNAAKELLGTDLTIREVGHLVGIADHCYFSRFFHRTTGITPSQYRRKAAKSAKKTSSPQKPTR